MKIKATLRIGLVLLYITIGMCCKSNTDNPPPETDTITVPAASLAATSTNTTVTDAEEDTGPGVYICKSAGAKRYHLSKACRGLIRCEHEIGKVSVEEAKELGLTLCRWED